MYAVQTDIPAIRQQAVGSLSYYLDFKCLSSAENSVYLRNKLSQVLQLLLSKQGHTVTRQELIDVIWNGNSYIGHKALTHTICKLRKIFKDLGQTELALVTIPKLGYSLVPADILLDKNKKVDDYSIGDRKQYS